MSCLETANQMGDYRGVSFAPLVIIGAVLFGAYLLVWAHWMDLRGRFHREHTEYVSLCNPCRYRRSPMTWLGKLLKQRQSPPTDL